MGWTSAVVETQLLNLKEIAFDNLCFALAQAIKTVDYWTLVSSIGLG